MASKAGVAPSKLLIPLSYAAILGGTCTLIGSSTNLFLFTLGLGGLALQFLRNFFLSLISQLFQRQHMVGIAVAREGWVLEFVCEFTRSGTHSDNYRRQNCGDFTESLTHNVCI
jgi:hypothetical protein